MEDKGRHTAFQWKYKLTWLVAARRIEAKTMWTTTGDACGFVLRGQFSSVCFLACCILLGDDDATISDWISPAGFDVERVSPHAYNF